jgi:energy-converting hydrogenase Eha subunit B
MEILVKGVKKAVNIGDSVKLVTGEIAKVTGDFGGAVIVRTDTNEIRVVEAKDIIDIVVMLIKELGLIDRFLVWLKSKLGSKK